MSAPTWPSSDSISRQWMLQLIGSWKIVLQQLLVLVTHGAIHTTGRSTAPGGAYSASGPRPAQRWNTPKLPPTPRSGNRKGHAENTQPALRSGPSPRPCCAALRLGGLDARHRRDAATGVADARLPAPAASSTSTTGATTSPPACSRNSRPPPASTSTTTPSTARRCSRRSCSLAASGYDVVVVSAPLPRAPRAGGRLPRARPATVAAACGNLDAGPDGEARAVRRRQRARRRLHLGHGRHRLRRDAGCASLRPTRRPTAGVSSHRPRGGRVA